MNSRLVDTYALCYQKATYIETTWKLWNPGNPALGRQAFKQKLLKMRQKAEKERKRMNASIWLAFENTRKISRPAVNSYARTVYSVFFWYVFSLPFLPNALPPEIPSTIEFTGKYCENKKCSILLEYLTDFKTLAIEGIIEWECAHTDVFRTCLEFGLFYFKTKLLAFEKIIYFVIVRSSFSTFSILTFPLNASLNYFFFRTEKLFMNIDIFNTLKCFHFNSSMCTNRKLLFFEKKRGFD